jgi:Pyruvate/2-oxoacid:ferredoxin oxidoreductase delta subunit
MSPELREAWDDFVQSRIEIKFRLTETAIKMNLKHLYTLSLGNERLAAAILNQSSRAQWRGLFPLNEQNREMFQVAEFERRRREQIQCKYCALYITERTKEHHEDNECTMAPKSDPERAMGMIADLTERMRNN